MNPLSQKIDIDGKTNIKYKIKPELKVKKLLKGKFYEGALEHTKVSLNISHQMEDSVEVYVNINGTPFKLGSDGELNATIGATKTF